MRLRQRPAGVALAGALRPRRANRFVALGLRLVAGGVLLLLGSSAALSGNRCARNAVRAALRGLLSLVFGSNGLPP